MTTLSGIGGLSTTATVTAPLSVTATLAGVGGLSAVRTVTTTVLERTATLAGVGGLSAVRTVTTTVLERTATLAGVGGLSVVRSVLTLVQRTATLAGVGGWDAAVGVSSGNRGVYQDISALPVGTTLVLSASVRAPLGTGRAIVRLSDGGGFNNLVETAIDATSTWQRISVTKAVPASGSLRVSVLARFGDTIDVDAVQLESGTTPSTFTLNLSEGDAGTTFGYTVARNLDGSGANDWSIGDAIFNTGQTGSGFIDLYSVRGIKSASQAGPTIVGNVRQSLTYNDWAEHWAIGNLKGLYDYSVDTYGVAIGKYSTTTPWLSADATNGIRIMRGSIQRAHWATDGTIRIGSNDAGQFNMYVDSTAIRFRQADNNLLYAGGTTIQMYSPTDPTTYMAIDTTQLRFYRAGTLISRFGSDLALYDPTDTTNYLQLTNGEIRIVDASLQRLRLNGAFTAFGENTTAWATTRITLTSQATTIGEANESVASGTFMLGRNGSGQPNLIFNPSNNRLDLRVGTTSKLYFDTNGRFRGVYASLDEAGLKIIAPTYAYEESQSYAFTDESSGETFARMTALGGEYRTLDIATQASPTLTTQFGNIGITAVGKGNTLTEITLKARYNNISGLSAPTFSLRGSNADGGMAWLYNISTLLIQSTTTEMVTAPTITAQYGIYPGDPSYSQWGAKLHIAKTNTGGEAIELVPHAWSSGATILFNAYSTGDDSGLLSNTRRSIASTAYNKAPGAISWDGNTPRLSFHFPTSLTGAKNDLITWSEKLRLESSLLTSFVNGRFEGIYLFGAAAPTSNQRVRIISTGDSSGHYPLAVVNSTNANSYFYIQASSATTVAGFLAAGAWTYSSDERLKHAIRLLSTQESWAIIEGIQASAYVRNADPDEREELGFIAQQVAQVHEGLITIDPNQMLGIQKEQLFAPIVAALQDLQRRVAALEAQ